MAPRFFASPDERRVLEVLGPDAGDHVAARAAHVAEHGDLGHRQLQPVAVERGRHEVHRGRADEAGHEQVLGLVVELHRRAHLLQHAGAHHRHPVAEGHRLGLVVGHVDGGGAEALLDPRDLGAHLHAQLRVEVRQRLVHQERRRVAHDRAAHRHALALAAGEVGGLAVEVLGRGRASSRPPRPSCRSPTESTFASLSAKPMFSRTVMCG